MTLVRAHRGAAPNVVARRAAAEDGAEATEVDVRAAPGLEDTRTTAIRQRFDLPPEPAPRSFGRADDAPGDGEGETEAGSGSGDGGSGGGGGGEIDDRGWPVRARASRQAMVAPTEPVPLALAPGRRIGKYELGGRLGMGTFGLIFAARDTELDRDVAIKVLNPAHVANRDLVLRFLQEARTSARIQHPGIVTVFDAGRVPASTGDTAFIAMERLQGESLTSRLGRGGPLAPEAACEIVRQVASALEAAHRADVLHRDLKPDNIYLVPDPAVPAGERAKVLDFGLAKLGRHGHTMANTIFGTPRYMSPEQCRSTGEIDPRSDVYALGCILFELVTGRTPFDGDLRRLIERHQRATPPRARSFAPEISAGLDDLIDRMLAKDPAARPQTMGALQRALQELGALALAPAPAPTARGSGPRLFDASLAELLVPPQQQPPSPARNPALMLPPEAHHRRWRTAAITAAVAVFAGLLAAIATLP